MNTATDQGNNTTWKIPRIAGTPLSINLQTNDCLFIVGPNGSGKSALIRYLVFKYKPNNFRLVPAHRQTAIVPERLSLSYQERKNVGQQHSNYARSHDARWRDHDSSSQQAGTLYDFVAKENFRARSIVKKMKGNNLEEDSRQVAESESPFDQLNNLLSLGTLKIILKLSEHEEILAKHEDVSLPYNIAQMSDGERNAAIIGAYMLTVDPGTVLLIDEPEQHLHPSIVVPFLSTLFTQRDDCIFIVSTHELALPVAIPSASVLMVRSCEWCGEEANAWDIDLLKPDDDLPEDLRIAVLGSRSKVLFVEGTEASRDLPIYNALFPDISVVAKGDSTDVIRAVEGVRGSQDLHRVEAFGLIDNDGRTPEDICSLSERGVFALDVYSVESLYYNTDSLDAVACWQAQTFDKDKEKLKDRALDAAVKVLGKNGLAERMAARRCEIRVKDLIASKAPNWETIRDCGQSTFQFCVKSPFQEELKTFRELLETEEVARLVARYPLRESGLFNEIARALEFSKAELYEQALIVQVKSDEHLADKLRCRIGPLSCELGEQSKESLEEGR